MFRQAHTVDNVRRVAKLALLEELHELVGESVRLEREAARRGARRIEHDEHRIGNVYRTGTHTETQ